MHLLSDSVASTLLLWALMMTTSMTLMLEGTLTVIKVFLWCFNISMGVMLWSPIVFFPFLPSTYAFFSYHDQSTVWALSTIFLFLISFYLHDPGTTCSILEYSVVLPIILLPSSTFFYLVILLTIGVYKLHSSPLPFSTLVYFVLLASIHLLLTPLDLFKSSSYFWVDAFLFEPLNPWKQLRPSCYVETPQHPPVSLHRKNLWPYKVYAHPYLG